MDEVDRQLISLLRNDARMSVATLAKALRVSRGTVSVTSMLTGRLTLRYAGLLATPKRSRSICLTSPP